MRSRPAALRRGGKSVPETAESFLNQHKKDLDIAVGENTVTIKGESRREEKEEKENYYRRELSCGSFSRTVGLPAAVDGAQAKAEMKEGVLEITLPKVEGAKRRVVKVE